METQKKIVRNVSKDKILPETEIKQKHGLKSNNSISEYRVANNHSADIIIQRRTKGDDNSLFGITLEPLTLSSGRTQLVNGELWDILKTTDRMIQIYLDLQILTEEGTETRKLAIESRTSNPVPPDALQLPDEIEGEVGKTRIVREESFELGQ